MPSATRLSAAGIVCGVCATATAAHEEITVTVTRAHHRSLGLRPDLDVWLAPTHGAVVPLMSPAEAATA